MKKTLIIALCCISVLFAACNKEKPNEKFIGYYEGSGIVNGTFTVNVAPGQSMNQDLKNIAIPMTIQLTAGETKNEVLLTYTNEDIAETYNAKGTVTDNKVAFNPVTINQVIEGTTVLATLNMNGVLIEKEGILQIDGTVEGNGMMADGGLSLPFTLSGTITANLNKVASPTPAPEVEPTLTLKTGTGYLSEGDEIEVGSNVKIGFIATGKKLNTLNVAVKTGDETFFTDSFECEGFANVDHDLTFTLSEIGDITLTATLTDASNHLVTLNVNFKGIEGEQPEADTFYQGSVTLDGNISTQLGLNFPVNGAQFEMKIGFTETTPGNLTATVVFEDNTYTTTGTKTDDTITLEPFEINLDIEGSSLSSTLTLRGTLDNATLTVEGDIEGSGNMTISGIPGQLPVTLIGTISGELTETSR